MYVQCLWFLQHSNVHQFSPCFRTTTLCLSIPFLLLQFTMPGNTLMFINPRASKSFLISSASGCLLISNHVLFHFLCCTYWGSTQWQIFFVWVVIVFYIVYHLVNVCCFGSRPSFIAFSWTCRCLAIDLPGVQREDVPANCCMHWIAACWHIAGTRKCCFDLLLVAF